MTTVSGGGAAGYPRIGGHHVVAGRHGGTSARWRRAAVAVALSPAVCAAAAVAASAAVGYSVTATIEVGNTPGGVAVDPTTHTAYVTNINDDTVSVIDEATNTVTATIAVGAGPLAVAVDPTTHTAYVTNGGTGTVSVIDGATNTVTATFAVGSGPGAVAVDSAAHTVYVANGGAGTVSVIDETTNTVTASIPVGSDPGAVAVDSAAHTVYVANGGAGTVSVIDETTGVVTATIPVDSGSDAVAVDAAAGTVYVANYSGTVSVIDAATSAVTAVPVGSDPLGVAVDSSTHTAYATNGNASSVSVISVVLPTPVTTVTSSSNPSTFGQNVTFTAKVGPADGGAVTFSSGSKALCRAVSLIQVSGRTYRAACTTGALSAGRHTITATYLGDASYATSAGHLAQIVNRAPTALTASVWLSPQPALILTATLTASGRPLSGQPVSFSTGPTHLCTAHTGTRGVATCSLTGPQTRLAEPDNSTIRASYPGRASYLASSATAVLLPLP
jgi:YVTN family beta-propeller protein